MKTKLKPRARRMWANYYKGNFLPALHPSRKSSIQHCAPSVEHKSVPVAVIPLDDVESLKSAAYAAYCSKLDSSMGRVCAALTAIGVLPRTRKGGAK